MGPAAREPASAWERAGGLWPPRRTAASSCACTPAALPSGSRSLEEPWYEGDTARRAWFFRARCLPARSATACRRTATGPSPLHAEAHPSRRPMSPGLTGAARYPSGLPARLAVKAFRPDPLGRARPWVKQGGLAIRLATRNRTSLVAALRARPPLGWRQRSRCYGFQTRAWPSASVASGCAA